MVPAPGAQAGRASIFTLASPVTHIIVGKPEEQQTFQIHRDLLCHHSKYFRAALTGEFEEAKTGIITLDDISIRTLQAFTGWLYFGKLQDDHKLATTKSECQDGGDDERDNEDLSLDELVDIWIFGDRVNIPALQNHALDTLHLKATTLRVEDSTRRWPEFVAPIPRIYAHTTHDAKLRAWTIEHFHATSSKTLSMLGKITEVHVTDFDDSTSTNQRIAQT